MAKKSKSVMSFISQESVEKRIYLIRDKRVMLDHDLSILYKVSTKILNQAVKRNLERFPEDFMFQLTKEELRDWMSRIVVSKPNSLRSQIVTLKRGQHKKYLPYAFTEQGVAMLSSVLNSPQAIQVNIQIIRTFLRIREINTRYNDLWLKIDELEKKYDGQFQMVFKAIKLLVDERPGQNPPKRF